MKLVRESINLLAPQSEEEVEEKKKTFWQRIKKNRNTLHHWYNSMKPYTDDPDNDDIIKEINNLSKHLGPKKDVIIIDENSDYKLWDVATKLVGLPPDYEYRFTTKFDGYNGQWHVDPTNTYAYVKPFWQGDSDSLAVNIKKLKNES